MRHVYLDATTYLERKQEGTMTLPDGKVPVILTFGDWRDVEGVKFPFAIDEERVSFPPQTFAIYTERIEPEPGGGRRDVQDARQAGHNKVRVRSPSQRPPRRDPDSRRSRLGGRWWWRATHPLVPPDTTAGWVPAVVAAGHRTRLSEPFGIALGPDGSIYVSEGGDAPAIRRVTSDGDVRPLAGGRRGFADGRGSSAAFDTPSHLALGRDGALYVADTGNHAIRRVTPEGDVSTIAGDGAPGGGDGAGARLNGPVGVAAGVDGSVLVADTYNDRIVRLDAPASAGSSSSPAGGVG